MPPWKFEDAGTKNCCLLLLAGSSPSLSCHKLTRCLLLEPFQFHGSTGKLQQSWSHTARCCLQRFHPSMTVPPRCLVFTVLELCFGWRVCHTHRRMPGQLCAHTRQSEVMICKQNSQPPQSKLLSFESILSIC